MLVAHPIRFSAWTFELREEATAARREGRVLGRVRLLRGDAAEITIGGVPFGMGSDRRRRHFVLTFEGVEVARAQQPSSWRRRLLVLVRGAMLDRAHAVPGAADLPLELRAEHALSRAFEVRSGTRRVGRIRPRHPFTTRTEIAVEPVLPPAVQAFLFALVAVQWRRARERRG